MKTAEEIEKVKSGLLIHSGCICDDNCPYFGWKGSGVYCSNELCNDAYFVIKHLEAQVPRWISAEERLPEPLQYVLVINRYDDDSFEPLVAYNRAGQWFTGSYMGGDVTHWMPLPEAPKEDAQ